MKHYVFTLDFSAPHIPAPLFYFIKRGLIAELQYIAWLMGLAITIGSDKVIEIENDCIEVIIPGLNFASHDQYIDVE